MNVLGMGCELESSSMLSVRFGESSKSLASQPILISANLTLFSTCNIDFPLKKVKEMMCIEVTNSFINSTFDIEKQYSRTREDHPHAVEYPYPGAILHNESTLTSPDFHDEPDILDRRSREIFLQALQLQKISSKRN